MKTYTKEIETPKLVIECDTNSENPREEWSNLGHFITCEKRYNSPDDDEVLKSIIQNLSEESANVEGHIKKIKEELPHNGYGKVLAIYPVYKYEHGNVIYRRGTAQGFDYSNSGFYIVTDKTQAIVGTPKDRFDKVIDGELETYTKWVNGEVYRFTLYNDKGEIEDSCGGFYDIEDIKSSLPEDWKDEDLEQYIK